MLSDSVSDKRYKHQNSDTSVYELFGAKSKPQDPHCTLDCCSVPFALRGCSQVGKKNKKNVRAVFNFDN